MCLISTSGSIVSGRVESEALLGAFIQENLRRLLSTNDASSEFNSWCEVELRKFNTDVDGQLYSLVTSVTSLACVCMDFTLDVLAGGWLTCTV